MGTVNPFSPSSREIPTHAGVFTHEAARRRCPGGLAARPGSWSGQVELSPSCSFCQETEAFYKPVSPEAAQEMGGERRALGKEAWAHLRSLKTLEYPKSHALANQKSRLPAPPPLPDQGLGLQISQHFKIVIFIQPPLSRPPNLLPPEPSHVYS